MCVCVCVCAGPRAHACARVSLSLSGLSLSGVCYSVCWLLVILLFWRKWFIENEPTAPAEQAHTPHGGSEQTPRQRKVTFFFAKVVY